MAAVRVRGRGVSGVISTSHPPTPLPSKMMSLIAPKQAEWGPFSVNKVKTNFPAVTRDETFPGAVYVAPRNAPRCLDV